MAKEQTNEQPLGGFTRDEYEKLLKLVYLGNWMVNAIRHPDDELEDFKQIKSKFLALTSRYGLEDYAEYDDEKQLCYASEKLSDHPEVVRMRDEYDDEVFWGELIIRLTRRDLLSQYGRDKVKQMDLEERVEKEAEIEQKYWQEFRENGLERLGIAEAK